MRVITKGKLFYDSTRNLLFAAGWTMGVLPTDDLKTLVYQSVLAQAKVKGLVPSDWTGPVITVSCEFSELQNCVVCQQEGLSKDMIVGGVKYTGTDVVTLWCHLDCYTSTWRRIQTRVLLEAS